MVVHVCNPALETTRKIITNFIPCRCPQQDSSQKPSNFWKGRCISHKNVRNEQRNPTCKFVFVVWNIQTHLLPSGPECDETLMGLQKLCLCKNWLQRVITWSSYKIGKGRVWCLSRAVPLPVGVLENSFKRQNTVSCPSRYALYLSHQHSCGLWRRCHDLYLQSFAVPKIQWDIGRGGRDSVDYEWSCTIAKYWLIWKPSVLGGSTEGNDMLNLQGQTSHRKLSSTTSLGLRIPVVDGEWMQLSWPVLLIINMSHIWLVRMENNMCVVVVGMDGGPGDSGLQFEEGCLGS